MRHWIIVINILMMYKSTSGPFLNYYFDEKLMFLMKKLCIDFKQDYGMN